MTTIKVKQVRSRINCTEVQKRTLDSLGLTKMHKVVEHNDTPSIRGMINRVHHLVQIVE